MVPLVLPYEGVAPSVPFPEVSTAWNALWYSCSLPSSSMLSCICKQRRPRHYHHVCCQVHTCNASQGREQHITDQQAVRRLLQQLSRTAPAS